MTKRAKKYLFDISLAIDHIFHTHLLGVADQAAFEQNLTVQRAIEREIGIIGEAVSRLQKMEVTLANADPIINRRNTIIHQYDAFKPPGIWAFVHQDLPTLKQEVDALLI